jgi:hypothetical protein
MRLFLLSAMIFFGTLFAAGLLALGEPTSHTPVRPHPDRVEGSALPAVVAAAAWRHDGSWYDLAPAGQPDR